MSRAIYAHIRSNVIGYIALFAFAMSGTATALSGHNTVFSDDIADNQVKSADVRDDTLTGGGLKAVDLRSSSVGSSEVQADSLTGADINESTLGQVPDAAQLGGKSASAFMASSTYRNESAVGPGTTLGDGTSAIAEGCNAGDKLLSGGPANIAATSTLLESFPDGAGSWTARINKNGQTDNFSVVVICADQ